MSAPLRFRFVGDHSRGQCAGAAVAEYLRTQLTSQGQLVQDEHYDILVVNGQGSMHHGSQHCRAKLRAMRAAQDRGKRVWLVNSVWQANDDAAIETLRGAERICVREKASQRELAALGIHAEVCLDLAYFARVDAAAPARDLRGEIALTDFYSCEFKAHVRIVGGELRLFEYLPVNELGWSGLVNSLKTCSLLVTGRHQAMYAACRARVPFVALRSDSHKIEGLIETSGLPIPVCSTPAELPSTIVWARRHPDIYGHLFDWMEAQPGWRAQPRTVQTTETAAEPLPAGRRSLWQRVRQVW